MSRHSVVGVVKESLGVATNWRRLLLVLDRYFDGVIKENRSTVDWFTKTALWVFEMRSSEKLPRCSRIKPRLSFGMVWPRTSVVHLWSWPHPLNRVCEYVWHYSRAATIRIYYYGILHKDKSRWSSNTGPIVVATKINPTEVDVHYYCWCDMRLFLWKSSHKNSKVSCHVYGITNELHVATIKKMQC